MYYVGRYARTHTHARIKLCKDVHTFNICTCIYMFRLVFMYLLCYVQLCTPAHVQLNFHADVRGGTAGFVSFTRSHWGTVRLTQDAKLGLKQSDLCQTLLHRLVYARLDVGIPIP